MEPRVERERALLAEAVEGRECGKKHSYIWMVITGSINVKEVQYTVYYVLFMQRT